MPTLDAAFAAFEAVCTEYASTSVGSSENEAEARLRLIDRLLFEVLGWPRSAPLEQQQGVDRLDYLLQDHEGLNWVVVEAKRPDHALVNPSGSGKDGTTRFKLGGPATHFGANGGAWGVFAGQLARYAAVHGTSIAVATNGHQWVGAVVPSRSGRPLADDFCVTFGSLDAIRTQFERFYLYFSESGVRDGELVRFLGERDAWAIRSCARPFRVIAPDDVQPLTVDRDEADQYFAEIERALDVVFNPIEDDPDLVEHCFVESRESRDADDRLARLADLLTERLEASAEPLEERVHAEAGRVQDAEVPLTSGGGTLALLTGEYSAGKTTYVRRFFGRKLARPVRDAIRLAHVRFDRSPDLNSAHDVRLAILEELERATFGEEGPDRAQLFDVFSADWRKHSRLFGTGEASEIQFVQTQLQAREQRPLDQAIRWMQHTVQRHRKLPVLVLDGMDHLAADLQVAALTAAVTAFQEVFAVVVVVLDDATVWRLQGEGHGDLFAKYASMRIWLPRPKIGEVLNNRFDYLKRVFAQSAAAGRSQAQTRIGRGNLQWTLKPDQVVGFLRDVLLFGNDEVRRWIEMLANYDIRVLLRICRTLILSPAIKREKVFGGLATGSATPLSERAVQRALIRPNHRSFKDLPHHFVSNIYNFGREGVWVPLGPLLTLARLDEKYRSDRDSSFAVHGFLRVEELEHFAERTLRVPRGLVRPMVEWMRVRELVQPYDPSVRRIERGDIPVKITPRGRLHLQWATLHWTYLLEMGETDAICDAETCARMHACGDSYHAAARDDAARRPHKRAFAEAYIGYLTQLVPADGLRQSEHTEVSARLRELQRLAAP